MELIKNFSGCKVGANNLISLHGNKIQILLCELQNGMLYSFYTVVFLRISRCVAVSLPLNCKSVEFTSVCGVIMVTNLLGTTKWLFTKNVNLSFRMCDYWFCKAINKM